MKAHHTLLQFGCFLSLFVSNIAFATCTVNSVPASSIQDAINVASPGDTITISGACAENIIINKDNLTIQGTGNITASANNAPTVLITARNATLQGVGQRLRVIGGKNNIRIQDGASARIRNVNVNSARGDNIVVFNNSFADFYNVNSSSARGLVEDGRGIVAEIGAFVRLDRVNSFNNAHIGIDINAGSIGWLTHTKSYNNGREGLVVENSMGGISDVEITGNGDGGITVQNGSLQVGDDDGGADNVIITGNGNTTRPTVNISLNSTVKFANTSIHSNAAPTAVLAFDSEIILEGGNVFNSADIAGGERVVLLINSVFSQRGGSGAIDVLTGGTGATDIGIVGNANSFIQLGNIDITAGTGVGPVVVLNDLATLSVGVNNPSSRINFASVRSNGANVINIGEVGDNTAPNFFNNGGLRPACQDEVAPNFTPALIKTGCAVEDE